MESPGEDVKLRIPTDDLPDKSSPSGLGISKFKQSRYEDVWPEDVHAAFMEAIALYPPMGKRRLKYYRVSTRETEYLPNTNQVKSFGRCQLIQSYILEKTGKNRSRKQVSSHLQRLKKIHNDNPAMRPLFSEHSYPPSEHHSGSQAAVSVPSFEDNVSADISFGTHQLKSESDFDLTINLRKTDPGTDGTSTLLCNSETSSYNISSCDAISPRFYPQDFLSPQQYSATFTLCPTEGDYFSETQDPFLFKDMTSSGLRAGSTWNTSTSSTPMRHFASKCRIPSRQVTMDFGSITSPSQAIHSPRAMQQWILHSGLTDDIPRYSPLDPAPQALLTPFYPLQLTPPERFCPDLASGWMWPQNPDTGISLGPRECTFGEVRLRYPPAMYQYIPTYPETRDNSESVAFHDSPVARNEVPPLPKGISCSYALTSTTTLSEGFSKGETDLSPQTVAESPEYLASPLVIRPTPVYPTSYIHSGGQAPAIPSLP